MVAATQVVGSSSGRDDAGGGMVAASSTQAMVVVVVVVGAVAGSRCRRVGVGCRRCRLVDNAGGGHCRRRRPWWGCRRHRR